MRTKFKAWTVPYLEEHQEVLVKADEISSFGHPFSLEIGSGKGQFLVDMAKKFPTQYFIGVERNTTCAGITAKKLVESPELINAKLVYDNADIVLLNLKDESVDNIFLNFSDPWPKKRHWKRRLSAPSYLDNYYRILKVGGRLIIKTDNVELWAFTKEMMETSKFVLESMTDDYQDRDEFDAETEYEKSFREEGIPIHRMVVRK